MSFGDVLGVLRRRWVIGVILPLAFLGLSVGVTMLSTPMYQSSTEIFVSTSTAGDVSDLAQANTFTQSRVQSYVSVATSPSVLNPVISRLGLNTTADALASRITASAPLNKVLIDLSVVDTDPNRAAQIANAVAEEFQNVVRDIEVSSGASQSSIKLTVIRAAIPSTNPVSPSLYLNLAVGLVLGLLVGLAGMFLRDYMDKTLKSVDALGAVVDAPVLGMIPYDKTVLNTVVAFRDNAHSERAEAFRQLRTNLHFVDVDVSHRVLCIASAVPGEGKSHCALNLAAALAEAGKRVCLVDADLRRPSIGNHLGLISSVGLTSVLVNDVRVEDVLQNAGHNFAVLTSGPTPPNPAELLASASFKSLIHYLSERVDVVVIDSAPVLPVADGAEVAALADATLLTVRHASTSRDEVRRAVATLANVGVVPVGVVFSMISKRRAAGYSYYEYYGSRNSDGSLGADLTSSIKQADAAVNTPARVHAAD